MERVVDVLPTSKAAIKRLRVTYCDDPDSTFFENYKCLNFLNIELLYCFTANPFLYPTFSGVSPTGGPQLYNGNVPAYQAFCLSECIETSGSSGRVGKSVVWKALQLKLMVQANPGARVQNCSVALVQWRRPYEDSHNGAFATGDFPTHADVFSGAYDGDPLSIIRDTDVDRFRQLKRWNFTIIGPGKAISHDSVDPTTGAIIEHIRPIDVLDTYNCCSTYLVDEMIILPEDMCTTWRHFQANKSGAAFNAYENMILIYFFGDTPWAGPTSDNLAPYCKMQARMFFQDKTDLDELK